MTIHPTLHDWLCFRNGPSKILILGRFWLKTCFLLLSYLLKKHFVYLADRASKQNDPWPGTTSRQTSHCERGSGTTVRTHFTDCQRQRENGAGGMSVISFLLCESCLEKFGMNRNNEKTLRNSEQCWWNKFNLIHAERKKQSFFSK